jgi:hypothetical protein
MMDPYQRERVHNEFHTEDYAIVCSSYVPPPKALNKNVEKASKQVTL